MKWEEKKLSQCCESITDGDHLPPPKVDSGIPFITISNIDSFNQIDFTNTSFVPQQYYDSLTNTRKAKQNDILYSVVGSFGVPVLIKNDKQFVFQRHIAILRPNDTIDPRFLYYTMKSPLFFAQADAVALGAAQRTISLTSLRGMTINVPKKETQHRIAAILSAYDDLIDNNRQQIKLLEEAAQRLYKEWFIDLRFPGWETTPIVDGLPEGWKAIELLKITKVNERQLSRSYALDYIDYIDIGSVRQGVVENTTRYLLNEAPGRAKRICKDGDIIWGMVRPNLRSHALIINPSKSMVFSTGFAVVTAKNVPYSFLYCHMTQDAFVGYLVNCTNGAAYPAVKPEHFKQALICLPSKAILEIFDDIVQPFFKNSDHLKRQINFLSQARDALLPKLMSAEEEK